MKGVIYLIFKRNYNYFVSFGYDVGGIALSNEIK